MFSLSAGWFNLMIWCDQPPSLFDLASATADVHVQFHIFVRSVEIKQFSHYFVCVILNVHDITSGLQ